MDNRIQLAKQQPSKAGLYDVVYGNGEMGKGLWQKKQNGTGQFMTLNNRRVIEWVKKEEVVEHKEFNLSDLIAYIDTLDLGRVELCGLIDHLNKKRNWDFYLSDIESAVCKVCKCSKLQLTNKSKKHNIVQPKQLFSYFAYEAGYTSVFIGKYLGYDHTTVLYHHSAIKRDIVIASDIAEKVQLITAILQEQ